MAALPTMNEFPFLPYGIGGLSPPNPKDLTENAGKVLNDNKEWVLPGSSGTKPDKSELVLEKSLSAYYHPITGQWYDLDLNEIVNPHLGRKSYPGPTDPVWSGDGTRLGGVPNKDDGTPPIVVTPQGGSWAPQVPEWGPGAGLPPTDFIGLPGGMGGTPTSGNAMPGMPTMGVQGMSPYQVWGRGGPQSAGQMPFQPYGETMSMMSQALRYGGVPSSSSQGGFAGIAGQAGQPAQPSGGSPQSQQPFQITQAMIDALRQATTPPPLTPPDNSNAPSNGMGGLTPEQIALLEQWGWGF